MSRVAPRSRGSGQPRRVTANWAFEETGRRGVHTGYGAASQESYCYSASQMTDTRGPEPNGEATPWWHESATHPASQPLITRDSPAPQLPSGYEENNSQASSGIRGKRRRPSGSGSEQGGGGEGSHQNGGGGGGRRRGSRGEPAGQSVGSEVTPLQYTIDCSPEVSTSTEDCTNDGADSGLGSATMLSGNQEVMEYMAHHMRHYLNLTAILPHLLGHNLLTDEDAAYIGSAQRSDEEKKERLLSALAVQETDSMERLVECLVEEKTHSGHRHLARRLREALEKKRQHPDVPLSAVRLGSPAPATKEPSPPPIKPRGTANRNSIAKLLATKRNNVASLISQIEIKDSTQPVSHEPPKPRPRRQSQPSEPSDKQEERNNGSMHGANMGIQYNVVRSTHVNSLPASSVASPATSTGSSVSYSPHPVKHTATQQQQITPLSLPPQSHSHPTPPLRSPPPQQQITPLSPQSHSHPTPPLRSPPPQQQITPLSPPSHSHPTPPLRSPPPQQQITPLSPQSHSHPIPPLRSPPPRPLSPFYSHHHPVVTSSHSVPLVPPHTLPHSHPAPNPRTPPHSHSPTSHTSQHSPTYMGTPPLPHTPPLSNGSQDDTPSSGSPNSSLGGSRWRRPVNEVVLRRTTSKPLPGGAATSPSQSPLLPGSATSTSAIMRVSLMERERLSRRMSSTSSGSVSDAQSRRKSLPDLLSSPVKSPKTPMLPPSLHGPHPTYVYPPVYTETPDTDEPLSSPSVATPPDCSQRDHFQEPEVSPPTQRQRTSRLAGLSARFYKHRRSASMSSFDARSFKRGSQQLSESLGGGMMERSPRMQGKDEHGKVRSSLREGTEKLVKRRIDWLQERVHFTDCPEHIEFTSHTHYGEERELLYSGTLNKHGKGRFVVLFTDMLLVLKARRPRIPSKLGGVFSIQSSRIDWFSDLEYTARKPLPLHLLTVQHKSSKQSNDSFVLHFNDHSKVLETLLQSVSKEAGDIWVEELSEAITLATSAHADTFVLIGNKAVRKASGEPYRKLHLQIHAASSLGLAANCNSFSLFCVIELGKQRCRTPSAMGGYNPSWEYKCEFTDFEDEDSLLIEVFSENIFRPNDFLGCVNVTLSSLPEEQAGRRVYDGNMVLAGLEEAYAGELHLTVEQGWETKM